ncbi:hypothetical protein [Celeribacter halophilus]|uniref:hypothetical protein n=1 Tax=Celeribacter halophilus TaxID=576117 RepID=UPI003A8E1AEE
MKYNRSAIMKAAWKSTRERMRLLGYAQRQLRQVFAVELQSAWRAAKARAAYVPRSIESLRSEVIALEQKTRLGVDGLQRLSNARAALRKLTSTDQSPARGHFA